MGDETHHEPARTIYNSYGMFGIPTHDPAHHAESVFEPNTTPGGTPIPFHVERFGSTSHITPSILAVEATSHVHPRPSVSNHVWIPEPRQVTIGNTTYIPSHVPSSSNHVPSNAFLTTLPPPHSHGPSGQNITTSHVHTATARTVVPQNQVPPILSGGHILVSRSSYVPSQGVPHIPNYGHSHGIPYGASHGHYYGP